LRREFSTSTTREAIVSGFVVMLVTGALAVACLREAVRERGRRRMFPGALRKMARMRRTR
jgi:hypothetical protein